MKRIIIAGIYRSGSTWQFNAVRVILKQAGKKFNQHNIYHPELSIINPDAEYEIFKIHRFMPEYAGSDYIFTSYRDLTECAKSYKKLFGSPLNIIRAFEDYVKWNQLSGYDMTYKDLLDRKPFVVETIAKILCLEVATKKVIDDLDAMKPPKEGYDPQTCYFANHISTGNL